MRTVNGFKQLPPNRLSVTIDNDALNTRKARETQLNDEYLERHPDISTIPSWVVEDSEQCALHYTLGCFKALLMIAIRDLQEAEARIEVLTPVE